MLYILIRRKLYDAYFFVYFTIWFLHVMQFSIFLNFFVTSSDLSNSRNLKTNFWKHRLILKCMRALEHYFGKYFYSYIISILTIHKSGVLSTIFEKRLESSLYWTKPWLQRKCKKSDWSFRRLGIRKDLFFKKNQNTRLMYSINIFLKP